MEQGRFTRERPVRMPTLHGNPGALRQRSWRTVGKPMQWTNNPDRTPCHCAACIKIEAGVLRKERNTGDKEAAPVDKYICQVCGFVYDPAKGDPDGGIAPGTAFEDIPEDWVCPVCGVSKDNFVKYEE